MVGNPTRYRGFSRVPRLSVGLPSEGAMFTRSEWINLESPIKENAYGTFPKTHRTRKHVSTQ